MRITRIDVVPYGYELARPIGDVNLPSGLTHGSDLAVMIETDEGISGTTIGAVAAAGSIAALEEILVGENPRAVRALWEKMIAVTFKAGNAGPIKLALSAIDCALWDLRAKLNDVPLWRELGGSTSTVQAYASGLDTPLTDDQLVEYYRRMAALGISAGKLKVGRDREEDSRRLELMAEALGTSGKRPQLMIDANEFWTPKQAIQRIVELEQAFHLVWVEEPVRRWDHLGLRRVSDAVRAPIATGENLNIASEFVPLIVNGAVDVLQIAASTSGITGAMQVAEVAYAFGLPVSLMNCPGRFMAHLAAALPHHTMMEVLDVGRDAALRAQPPIRAGEIVLGDGPGSGIEFDDEWLAANPPESGKSLTIDRAYRRADDAGLVG